MSDIAILFSAFLGGLFGAFIATAVFWRKPELVRQATKAIAEGIAEATRKPAVFMPNMTEKEAQELDGKPNFVERLGLHKKEKEEE